MRLAEGVRETRGGKQDRKELFLLDPLDPPTDVCKIAIGLVCGDSPFSFAPWESGASILEYFHGLIGFFNALPAQRGGACVER